MNNKQTRALTPSGRVQKLLERKGYLVRGEKYENGAVIACRNIKIAVKRRAVAIMPGKLAVTPCYVFQLTRKLRKTVDFFVCIVGPRQDMYVFPTKVLHAASINISMKPSFTRYAQCWNEQFRNKVDLLFQAIEGQPIDPKVFKEGALALLRKHAPPYAVNRILKRGVSGCRLPTRPSSAR